MNTNNTDSIIPNKQLMFSFLTGDIYIIEADELKNMDKYQIPLLKRPSENCTQCFGRMHKGFNTTIKAYVLCNKCTPKCVDFKKLKSEEITVDTIKNA